MISVEIELTYFPLIYFSIKCSSQRQTTRETNRGSRQDTIRKE